jgi:hypothetical protein
MKAIETSYKGYRFRSRLEARWAVFFDHLGIAWKYEPEGFEKTENGGERVIRYLPDFYLPESGTWVEVKGFWTEEDAVDLMEILDYGSPLWHFDDCSNQWYSPTRRTQLIAAGVRYDQGGLLLLGDVPDLNFGYCYHPIVKHAKGLTIKYIRFSAQGELSDVPAEVVALAEDVKGEPRTDPYEHLDAYANDAKDALKFFSRRCTTVETKRAFKNVSEAYRAAKSARFEFGESGFRR